MVKYTINRESFNDSFNIKSKNGFQHTRGKLVNLFPFATDVTGLKDAVYDFNSFRGFIGDFIRRSKSISLITYPDKEKILSHIYNSDNIIINDKSAFSDILDSFLFDENDNMFLFNKEVLPFLSYKANNQKVKNIGEYIFNIFYDDEVGEIIRNLNDSKDNNVFYQLVLSIIKEIGQTKLTKISKDRTYKGKLRDNIFSQFKKDLRVLSIEENDFVYNIDKLFKHYFFLYITNLSIELNHFFNKSEKSTVEMTLHWEKLAPSRSGLQFGYPIFDKAIEDMFVHSNCIEMLNCITGSEWTNTLFTYVEISEQCENMSEEEESSFALAIRDIIDIYRNYISSLSNNKVIWSEYYLNNKEFNEKFESLSNIRELFSLIRYQFMHSGRKSVCPSFKKWFYTFCKSNMIKSRGKYGNSIGIDQETLLLFTKLSIGSTGEDKILLKRLWKEFALRGLHFDNKSKKEMVSFYQSINLLEKKSDSGDAQYVKKI